MIFRRKKAAPSPANEIVQAAREGYVGLCRDVTNALSASRRDGRDPSIVLLGRIQHDIVQAHLDSQWEAFMKAGDRWKESPPVISLTNGTRFRGLRVILVADANLVQVYQGTGDWK